jgi:hypothetical protein
MCSARAVSDHKRNHAEPHIALPVQPLYSFVSDKKSGDTNGDGTDALDGSVRALPDSSRRSPLSHTPKLGGY